MQEKYKIDRDTRTLLLKYIRKYEEYLAWYRLERERITEPSRVISNLPTGNNGSTSDPTLTAVERLEKLEHNHKTNVIRAIDQAKLFIGVNIPDEKQRLAMQRAIWLSCLNGREYNFEVFAGIVACERRTFYNYKNAFLNDVKKYIGL